jgi:hypothetical protein
MILRSAKRRMSRSLLVNAPSLNTGCVKVLVVAMGIFRPVSASAFVKRSMPAVRSASESVNGTRSSSWNVMP